jgi:hypothetical protein
MKNFFIDNLKVVGIIALATIPLVAYALLYQYSELLASIVLATPASIFIYVILYNHIKFEREYSEWEKKINSNY